MNGYRIAAALSAALLLTACGGKETTASKSAAAYRQAVANGTPIPAGEGHGHEHGEEAAAPAVETADHAAHEGMSEHQAMNHGTMDHAASEHAAMSHASMDHGSTPSTDHSTMHHETPAPAAASAPVESSAPPGTDAFDTPSPLSVAEAQKASGGGVHHQTSTSSETIYTCPMHPEVTSTKPGTCPKCGMTLVKREQE